jgi:sulfur carrier protein ThiS
MGAILFNAFSFLQKRLKEKNVPCTNARIPFSEGQRVNDILRDLNINDEDIDGVFVNGKIAPTDTLLKDGDRIAAFPPGTPGPYRLLLGIVKTKPNSSGEKAE